MEVVLITGLYGTRNTLRRIVVLSAMQTPNSLSVQYNQKCLTYMYMNKNSYYHEIIMKIVPCFSYFTYVCPHLLPTSNEDRLWRLSGLVTERS
jgi:hypothetical protein